MVSIILLFLLAASPALIPARLISSHDDRAKESMEMYDDTFVGPFIAAGDRRDSIDASDTGKDMYFGDRKEYNAVGGGREHNVAGDIREGVSVDNIDAGDRTEDTYVDDNIDVGDRSDDIYADDNSDVGNRGSDIYADGNIDFSDRTDEIYADDNIDVDNRSDDIYADDHIDVGDRTEDISVGAARDAISGDDARETKDDTIAQLTTKVNNMEETVKSLGSTVHKLLMENQSIMKRHKGVIFHAVLDQKEYTHMHIYDRIYFDTVMLNTMNGYRVNSGMFIAPETGLYIFSSSILSDNGPRTSLFEAEIVMNGIVLARLYGYGVNRYHAQGSATVVTRLNVADHVWVRLSCCGNDSLYGYRYSTFSGALIT